MGKPLKSMVCAAASCLCAALAATARADTAATAPAPQRVEITGSLLRQIDAETALPVIVLTVDDLDKAGLKTIQDALQLLPQDQSIVGAASSVGSTWGGASFADLRNFGVGMTLVLVNGQRIVKNPYRDFTVDLNALPTVAIERIEVLLDGASSIYGSDAVAGVINVITRREFEGGLARASARMPQASGGDQVGAGLAWGFGSLAAQGFNVYAGIDAIRERRIRALDRSYASTAWLPERGLDRTSTITFPANYSQSPAIAVANPTLPGCRLPTSVPTQSRITGLPLCGYDLRRDEDLLPDIQRWSLAARGTLALGANDTAALEYFRAYNRVSVLNSPSPVTGLTMRAASPYFPGGSAGVPSTNTALDPSRPIAVSWRITDAGLRGRVDENVTQRLLAQWEGRRGRWNQRATLHYSRADVDLVFSSGYVIRQRIVDGLLGANGAPFLNPFGPQSEAGLAYLDASESTGRMQQATSTLRGANATFGGELVALPAGPLDFAVGADLLEQRLAFRGNDALIRQIDSPGVAVGDLSGAMRSRAVFGELNVPILENAWLAKRLGTTLSVRHDDYANIGTTINPKLSVRWQVVSPLLIRASANRGFSVPPIAFFNGPNAVVNTQTGLNDPLLCPRGVPVTGAVPLRDCNAQFSRLVGGNPGLAPSRSRSWLAGFVVDIGSKASVGVDLFRHELSSTLWTVGAADVLADPVRFAALIVRCSELAPERAAEFRCAAGAVDPIAYLDGRFQNLGVGIVRGADLAVRARGDFARGGRFTFALNGAYVDRNALQQAPGGPFTELAGRYVLGFPTSRWQHVAHIGWERGAWSARLVNRFKRGYADSNTNLLDPAVFGHNRVGNWSVFDASISLRNTDGLTLTAGLLNIFDKDPPFSNQQATLQTGYEPRVASPIGRALFVQASFRFQ